MAEPGYTRLQVDERRRRLLELGARLFATHCYGELSMARIAREAGISKALLYHYFPSKQDFFVATLQQGAEEIARRTEPDPDLPPFEALAGSLEGYLGWIEENEAAYRRLMEGVILDWLEHRDMSRAEVRDFLLASLGGSLSSAGSP